MQELDGIRYSKEVPCIEPDLGDLRKSTDKALPGLPKTPKRVLKKYRFSAVLSMALAIASFVLTLTLVLAGDDAHTFDGQYLAALYIPSESGVPVYQDVTVFESSSTTDTTETGNAFHLYLHQVCYDSPTYGSEVASDVFERICSRLLIMVSTTLAGVRITVFVSLIVSLVGSLLSTILAIPGIIYPHSRILAYINIMWPLLASTFAFLAATLLTIVIAGVFAAVDGVVNGVGVEVWQGGSVLFLAWLAWVLISLPVVYWGLVWFVEVRRWGFASRKRSEEEVGNWKGIGREVWSDLKREEASAPPLPTLNLQLSLTAATMRSSVSTATVPSKNPAPRGFTVKAEEQQEPKFENEHDHFFWTYTEEPHRTRRMAIIKAHPEVTKLCGPEPLTKYVVLLVVSIQVTCAYLLRSTPVLSWPFFLTAYVVGATANQNLFLAIHEISHNLAFRSPQANRLFAVFANLPIGIPYSASFRPYHLTHHKSLGVNGLDTDLPTAFEAIFLDSVAGKAFFATFQILFYALRPMFVYSLPMTKIHLFNVVVQLAFDYLLVQYAGGRALGYLIMSSFLAGSLHPCAGHFIAEHYVFEKPNKDAANPANKIPLPETYSYYGPLNLLTYNVGLHNEHHDFPAIPWTRLHTLNRVAHDFYKDLPQHKSWVYVLWQFIWDKDISLWCRVKREEGGRKVGGGGGWNEEELGSNEKKGPIPGVL
ncbi:dihydroceramide delta-desaturase [Bipolaris maydis]|nr:dihydroceramide delta-desaturase [Bipolaris maydis]KAJ6273658.1 dihydroceramide delta-desaturase [Bipolaris maydis]KAJ6284875.1 dihydroceramide delta-desaturase [Bipolaris maydis]